MPFTSQRFLRSTAQAVGTVLSALLPMVVQAAPVISPYADDLPTSSYSSNRTHPSTTVESVFNGGYWNAGGHGTYWIQADMGQTFSLSEVILTVGVLPENVTSQQVYLSDTPIGDSYVSLTPVASRTGHTTAYQQFDLTFAATSGRYLEIVSNGGASWTALGDPYGRSNWVDPTSSVSSAPVSSVPEPETYALMLGGLSVLGAMGRRRSRPMLGTASPSQSGVPA